MIWIPEPAKRVLDRGKALGKDVVLDAITGRRALTGPFPIMDPEETIPPLRDRICRAVMARAREDEARSLELVINDTIYHERKRLEQAGSRARREELPFWRQINHELAQGPPEVYPDLLRRIVTRYLEEILGSFDPRVYELSTQLVPVLLTGLLNALSPRRLLQSLRDLPRLSENLILAGETAQLRALKDRGTIILAPTHSSNLDSVAVGYGLYLLGLPPFLYGAGINLFTNPIMSFFMQNLGAYRLDRKKKADLYKLTLKEFSAFALERGHNSLFFPGGTRSRTGHVEQDLKLGLLGTGLTAYINNLRSGRRRPEIYIVPCTITYHLVLEAESLIADGLERSGGSRYVLSDDEFERPGRWLSFMARLFDMQSVAVLTFAPALDPFGNRVDEEGQSLDARGRRIDIRRYVLRGDRVVHDAQRDREYTRQLGEAVAQLYMDYNAPLCTHVTAFVMFELVRRANPGVELYRLLRTAEESTEIGVETYLSVLERVLAALQRLSDAGRIHPRPGLFQVSPQEVLDAALEIFGFYHRRRAMARRGDWLVPEHMSLLYYYSNRLRGYGLESLISGE
jgi:glycerol-3-phosphate O-acyltransferase